MRRSIIRHEGPGQLSKRLKKTERWPLKPFAGYKKARLSVFGENREGIANSGGFKAYTVLSGS